MQIQFQEFSKRIKLTESQREDALKKYKNVCSAIHGYYYTSKYDGKTSFLFGSYAKKTNIRPITEDQDVDVLFILPEEIRIQYSSYSSNGQSALLARIREVLSNSGYGGKLGEKPKAWGKVILIKTPDNKHNVELLPAFENEDGSFTIPNSEDNGTWDDFNPRDELRKFRESNNKTNKLTRNISRMVKFWAKHTPSVNLKSYKIENYVIDFLDSYDYEGKNYSEILKDFFIYLNDFESEKPFKTVKSRAIKAYQAELEQKHEKATAKWQKVFPKQGNVSFPSTSEFRKFYNIIIKAKNEEFIEERVNSVEESYDLEIDCLVKQNGFRPELLSKISFLKKEKSLEFIIKSHNIPEPFDIKWKVRNYGEEAEKIGQLRGEITDDKGNRKKFEKTAYEGEHVVECYAIKNNVCVARSEIVVPIKI